MLKTAIAQFTPGADKDVNLASMEKLIRRAADQDAALIVLPEYAIFTVPTMDDRFVESAESLDGPAVTRLREISQELGVTLVAGINETAQDGRIYNTLVGLQGGEIAAVYRKTHLYDAFGYKESDRVLAGALQAPQLMSVGGFTVGMQTCYDLRFPEVTRTLVDAGADVVALPAEWVPGPLKEFHWNTLIRARAIENTIYVLAADQAAPTGAGNSAILDPMGNTLASVGESEDLALAELSQERLEAVRLSNPALSLRRYRVAPMNG
ncbi:carbon-nitrogen hydrolase family protein [Nesterenkonia sandarakina]|uniref:Putative amidohydrolase n=1 Tax=Nesterenkonia sandarakina TaxID=272918 RepID=A0A7Z0E7P0_9MICC|nr:carbon-nitrogen hydrolase family protein [Nesterenkonia sandarakina]NYJ16456.1 putative amidohydrolase [Nesterenkonia sandarakina]